MDEKYTEGEYLFDILLGATVHAIIISLLLLPVVVILNLLI